MAELSEAVKQAIIQMAGSGVSLDRIMDMLREKGVEAGLEDVVNVILDKSSSSDDFPNVDDVAGVLKWLILKQLRRLNKLLGIESMSPLPLSETTNNLKILADLVVKYNEMLSKRSSVDFLKSSIFEVGRDEG